MIIVWIGIPVLVVVGFAIWASRVSSREWREAFLAEDAREEALADKMRGEQVVVLRPERCQTCKWWAEETNLEDLYYKSVPIIAENEEKKRACCVNPAGGEVKFYDDFCKEWEQRGGV